jgi:hypothetical protein
MINLFDFRTPCERKEKSDQYPKNFALLRMADKYKKAQALAEE